MATRQYVVFKIDGEDFGVDISKVVFIDKPQNIYKVPETSDFIEGVTNLRDKVYPVFNIRKKFHLEWNGIQENTKIIFVNIDKIDAGFIVDEVSEILKVDDEEIELTPEAIKSDKRKYITGVAKTADKVLLLLDLCKILSEEEQEFAEDMIKKVVNS